MIKKPAFLLSILLFLLVSCEKDKKNGNSDEIAFEGISITDDYGNLIFQDTTDWKFTENWSETESSLFSEKRDKTCTPENYDCSIVIYPNPCNSVFRFDIAIPDSSRFAFRIVDKDFKVLVSHDSIPRGAIGVTLTDFNLSNEVVRMYYKVLADNCELRGHGDIQIE
ncbi:MAG: hypothetical protein AB9834_05775 [Lentimicrobium sp.]